ncbi:hypothetical protein [Vampirovibrio sp.]|uniref:hypothetical protein n=1 Tax=Vampirovibrio sp. TaxID=2717857 RepID=UPI00359312BA
MAGISGFAKGVKAAFSKNHAGKTGLYKNSAGNVKAKPGFELAKGQKGGGTVKKDEFANALLRNPKTVAAVGGAGLVGGGLAYNSLSSEPSSPQAAAKPQMGGYY